MSHIMRTGLQPTAEALADAHAEVVRLRAAGADEVLALRQEIRELRGEVARMRQQLQAADSELRARVHTIEAQARLQNELDAKNAELESAIEILKQARPPDVDRLLRERDHWRTEVERWHRAAKKALAGETAGELHLMVIEQEKGGSHG